MKLKFAAAAAMLALTGAAFANTYTVADPLDTLGDEGYTSPTHILSGLNTSFTDDIFFTLGSKADLEAGFAILKTTTKNISITGFTLTRGSVVTPISYSTSSVGSFLFTGLKEGAYKLEITGLTSGSKGGSYYTNLTAAPAVPEPETVALAFAGLGVVGALARRRKTV